MIPRASDNKIFNIVKNKLDLKLNKKSISMDPDTIQYDKTVFSKTNQIHVATKSQFNQMMKLVNEFYGAQMPQKQAIAMNLSRLKNVDITKIDKLPDS